MDNAANALQASRHASQPTPAMRASINADGAATGCGLSAVMALSCTTSGHTNSPARIHFGSDIPRRALPASHRAASWCRDAAGRN